MPGDEYNQEEIVPERQKEKRGVEHAQDEKAEWTHVKKQPEQGMEEGVHASFIVRQVG